MRIDMQHPTGLAGFFDRIYQRTPRGIARVCVAAASGALFATILVLGRNGPIGRRYWYVFAGCGLAIGLVGGSILGVLDRREVAGQAPPLWWSVFRRVTLTFLKLLGLGLLLFLLFLMFRLVRENHLYGL
jgi:hypothetical protein